MFSWRHLPATPVIVGHRGASAIAPENTRASFAQAALDGAHAVELDVHLTKDGEVVVLHDASLQRTTSGRGFVKDFSSSQLRKLSAGGWFHSRFADERVPRLQDIFELLNDDIGVNIEIKEQAEKSKGVELVRRCVKIIQSFDANQRSLISSFSHSYITQSKSIDSSIPTGFLYHPLRHAVQSLVRLAVSYGIDFLILGSSMIRKHIVDSCHEKNIRVAEYTINTEARVLKACRFNIDVMITNDPRRIRKYVPNTMKLDR